MVAISLYKGNLRKATDAPRQWLMPTRQITIKDFRSLLQRRARALSRLPNPNPNDNVTENLINNDASNTVEKEDKEIENACADGSGGDCLVEVELDAENKVGELNSAEEAKEEERVVENAENPNSEAIDKGVEECSDPVRKKEVEEKLSALKEQKHNFVQALKMIQNAEEELKRRNSTQGRPSVSLQVDIPDDSGSITKLNTPRVRSDRNKGTTGADAEGGVPDGLVNHNSDSRHLVRMSSTSPSPDSQHKKPAHNSVPLPGRTPTGVSASPSRFAPSVPQVPSSLPTVSVSGTNYVPSSPSPAASGGTSVFRENRMTSPWN